MPELKRELGETVKVRIKGSGQTGADYSIFLNGVDVSTWVTAIRVEIDALDRPIVWLSFVAEPEFYDGMEMEVVAEDESQQPILERILEKVAA